MPDQPSRTSADETRGAAPVHDAHDAHDPMLIAALAANDLTGAERTTATDLAVGCPDCAELLADLRSIAAATAQLPAPARTRDFRLTEEDARRLRPGGWRGLVGILAGPRLAFTQPLAAGLTAIGFAGLLLFSLQGFGAGAPVLSSVGSSIGQERNSTQATGGAQAPGTPAPGAAASAGPSAAFGQYGSGDARASNPVTDQATPEAGKGSENTAGGQGGSASGAPSGTQNFNASSPGGGLPPLVALSGLAIVLGIALFLIRFTARRLSET